MDFQNGNKKYKFMIMEKDCKYKRFIKIWAEMEIREWKKNKVLDR